MRSAAVGPGDPTMRLQIAVTLNDTAFLFLSFFFLFLYLLRTMKVTL